MKKTFALLAAMCCTMALSAATYTCHLKVTINGESTEQDGVSVVVTENNGIYDLSLQNFILQAEGMSLPVGNIAVNNVQGTTEHGFTTIKYNGQTQIAPGDDPAYSESEWLGPFLGDVPLVLTSRFTDTALSANIDIDMMAMIGQVISVELFGVAPAAPALEGDVDHDGEVTLSDINAVIDIILSN